MTSPSASRAAPLPGYDLAPLTEDEACAMLRRVFGPDRGRAAWLQACRDAGFDSPATGGAARLERIAKALASQGGAAATVARSIEIRLRTHARLAARGVTVTGPNA